MIESDHQVCDSITKSFVTLIYFISNNSLVLVFLFSISVLCENLPENSINFFEDFHTKRRWILLKQSDTFFLNVSRHLDQRQQMVTWHPYTGFYFSTDLNVMNQILDNNNIAIFARKTHVCAKR